MSRAGLVAVLKAGRSLTFDDGDLGLCGEVASLLDAGTRAFVINVGGVAVIDSSGVAELVSCQTAISRRGGRLILCEPSPKVREVLGVTRLDGVIEARASEAEAIAELQHGS